VFRKRQGDWRHDVCELYGPVLKHFQERLELEAGKGYDRCAPHEAKVQDRHHAVDMKKRQHADERAQVRALDGVDLHEVRHDVAVGQHHALRKSCSPGRVGQHQDVRVGINRHRGSSVSRSIEPSERVPAASSVVMVSIARPDASTATRTRSASAPVETINFALESTSWYASS
jgi:hypothetical protein